MITEVYLFSFSIHRSRRRRNLHLGIVRPTQHGCLMVGGPQPWVEPKIGNVFLRSVALRILVCVCVTQAHTCEIRTKSWINASQSKDRTTRQGPIQFIQGRTCELMWFMAHRRSIYRHILTWSSRSRFLEWKLEGGREDGGWEADGRPFKGARFHCTYQKSRTIGQRQYSSRIPEPLASMEYVPSL